MKKAVRITVLSLIFLSLLFFAYRFPYSGDDWAFATSYGINQLKSGFSNLNGRYLGNLLAIIICRNNIVKTLFISSVIWLILYFGTKIIKKDNTFLIIILYILFLMANNVIFAQGIVWSSGFCNYATSTLVIILLLYLYLTKQHFKGVKYCYFILGLFGSFLVENVTICIWLIALIINVLNYTKTKKINYDYLYLFIGSTIGAFIMFLNPSYLRVLDNSDSYRRIRLANFKRSMMPYFFLNLTSLIFKIMVIILIIWHNRQKKVNWLVGSLFVISLVALYNFKTFEDSNYLYLVLGSYFLTGGLLLYINRQNLKNSEMFTFVTIVLLILPLFFVYPVGGRNFLTIYVLVNIFYLLLMDRYLKISKYLFIPVCGLLIFAYSYTFITANKDFVEVAAVKDSLINRVKKGEKNFIINADYYHRPYVHYPYPDYGIVKDGFSEYYKISNDWKTTYDENSDEPIK